MFYRHGFQDSVFSITQKILKIIVEIKYFIISHRLRGKKRKCITISCMSEYSGSRQVWSHHSLYWEPHNQMYILDLKKTFIIKYMNTWGLPLGLEALNKNHSLLFFKVRILSTTFDSVILLGSKWHILVKMEQSGEHDLRGLYGMLGSRSNRSKRRKPGCLHEGLHTLTWTEIIKRKKLRLTGNSNPPSSHILTHYQVESVAEVPISQDSLKHG